MTLISIVVTLIVVGVLLWLVNNYGGEFIDGKILKLINILVIVVVVLWLLNIFLGFGALNSVRVGQIK